MQTQPLVELGKKKHRGANGPKSEEIDRIPVHKILRKAVVVPRAHEGKDGDRGDEDTLLSIIDKWSSRSAKYVEIASIFASSVEKEEAEKATATAELGIISGIRFDNMVSIFDENYYDLLRFYTGAVQITSLQVVQIENNQFAFVAGIDYLVRLCDGLLTEYCELNSLSSCRAQ